MCAQTELEPHIVFGSVCAQMQLALAVTSGPVGAGSQDELEDYEEEEVAPLQHPSQIW